MTMIHSMKFVRSRLSPPNESHRDVSLHGSLWVLAACLTVLSTLFLSGCWGSQGAHAVDPSRAREALNTALEHWKKGAEPGSLASSATPMTVQDFEWAAGAKLIDYQVVDEGKAYDANLRVQVKLTMSGQGQDQGKTIEKKVWYLVTTSPNVTVFRDMLRK